MADKSAVKTTYTNKNIRKLRAISMVCGLTSSWQKWVTDNETKQANEPSGWAPSWLDNPTKEPPKTWTSKNLPKTESSKKLDDALEDKVSAEELPQTSEDTKESKSNVEPCSIKPKHVEITVTSAAEEKNIEIENLTEEITKETQTSEHQTSDEDSKLLLTKESSPTCRRQYSITESSLTMNCGQVGKTAINETEDRAIVELLDAEDGKEKTNVNDIKTDEREVLAVEIKRDEEESAVRIKRPTVTLYKKESEDANKINALSKSYSAVGSLKSRWQNWASEHTINQKLNPFSEYFDYNYSMSTRLQKGQEGYGRPKEGSKTAERARRAEQHIHREIDDMCLVIRTMADPDHDGKTRVTFGELFDRYVRISDKVVGILMRARKHGKLEFEGEMLWQGRDDGVIITLLV